MQAQGYWINGNQIIDVTFTSHIGYLFDHSEDFGFSRQEVDETFQRHGEKPGEEGRAREELIRRATTRGWIRVRRYVRPRDYWSVQFDKIEERKETIVSFLRSMIEQHKMSKDDELRLIGFRDGFKKICSFQEGGVGRFLEEQKRKPEVGGKACPLKFLKALGMSFLKRHKWLCPQCLPWHPGKTAPDDNTIASKKESGQSEDQEEKREGISSASPQLRCPRCESTKTKPVPVQMGFYVRCESCGNVWDTNKE
jgi:hypothetical protein